MDSSELSSGNNKEKKESNSKYSRWLFLVFFAMAILFLFLRLTGALDTNQYMTLLLTDAFLFVSSLSLILSSKQLSVSKLQEEAARESILASRDSIKSAVAPRLIFRIRPANDYWLDPFGKQASWEPGVGIYIDNFGLGTALNIRLTVTAFGEMHAQSCTVEFPKMLAGERYTLPSKKFPQLSVNKEDHENIIIESLEYDDIRNPPNLYRDKEPTILELKPEDFDESAREKIEKMGSTELEQSSNIVKILEFLVKQERTDAGEAWTSGEEIQSETGLDPFEINDAVENAKRRNLVEIGHPPPNYIPWKFTRVTITAYGRMWLEEVLSDKTDASKNRL